MTSFMPFPCREKNLYISTKVLFGYFELIQQTLSNSMLHFIGNKRVKINGKLQQDLKILSKLRNQWKVK